jgi:hypothetical protein
VTIAAKQIRRWLSRLPHPARVNADGREVVIGDGRKRFIEAADSILTIQPETIEAIDASGALLRVTAIDYSEFVDGDPQAGAAPSSSSSSTSTPSPLPNLGEPKSDAGELARLILEATDRGAQRHAEAWAAAFEATRQSQERMAELVSVAFERMTALEVAWQNALNDRVRDVVEGGEDDLDGPIGEVIKSVVARRMTQAPAQPNGSAPKPNGKGKA